MTRSIRSLAAKLFLGGAFLAPLAPAVAAEPNAPQTAVPEAKRLTNKELHAKLLKGSGWVQQRDGDKILSHGTGWVVDAERRLMVTNDHVISGQDVVWVVFPKYADGKLVREETGYAGDKGVKAVVIDRDRTRDLAVIQLDSLPEGTAALPLAAAEPEEGDAVRTIGGYTNGSDNLVFGGIGGEVRTVGTNGGLHRTGKVRVVLSTVSINGGNSGGPLVNEAGELVGVNSYTVTTGPTGRAVANVNGHISVTELKGYLAEVDPLVAPTAASGLVARGERKLSAGRWDAAIKDFSAALSKEADHADALHLRGKAFTQSGDARTGLDDLNAAVTLDGGRYEFRVARGLAFRALNKADEAAADFSAAIRTDPAKWDGYNERGITHYRAGKWAEAEEDFDRAVDKGPGVANLWANRADARFKRNKFDAAAADWKKAADLDPANQWHVVNWGAALIGAGKAGQAAELFVEAARTYGNPVFLTKAGHALSKAGDPKQAVKLYTDALKGFGDKGHPLDVADAYHGRGVAQRELKNTKEAIDDLSKAIDLSGGKNGWFYIDRGDAHADAGQTNAAADDYAAADKLGVKADRKVAKAAEPAKEKAADPMLGTWKMTTFVNGLKVTQVIEFKKDGTFEATGTVSSQFGSERTADIGTWKLTKNKLTLRGEDTGTVVRTITLDGDDCQVEVEEFGKTVTFSRVK